MEKIMYLMRGLPGSGKSTLAKELSGNDPSKVFSTDEFFETQVKGFDGALLHRAHQWNENRARKAMIEGVSPIVVDNTNIVLRDAKTYLEMAKANGYRIEIREPQTPWSKNVDELVSRNTHSVPRATIERMLKRYADHSTWPI